MQTLQIVLNELKKQSQKLSKIKKECLSITQQVTEIKQKLETKERSDFQINKSPQSGISYGIDILWYVSHDIG